LSKNNVNGEARPETQCEADPVTLDSGSQCPFVVIGVTPQGKKGAWRSPTATGN